MPAPFVTLSTDPTVLLNLSSVTRIDLIDSTKTANAFSGTQQLVLSEPQSKKLDEVMKSPFASGWIGA